MKVFLKAYKSLRLLLDPAVEGCPYILESEKKQKPFISLNPVTPGLHPKHSGYGVKRMSWR